MVYSLDFDDIADPKLHFFYFVILQDGGSKIHHQLVGVAAILRPLDHHSCSPDRSLQGRLRKFDLLEQAMANHLAEQRGQGKHP